jgi:hypothetical protein
VRTISTEESADWRARDAIPRRNPVSALLLRRISLNNPDVPAPPTHAKRRRKARTEPLVAVFSEADFAPLLWERIAPLVELFHQIEGRNGARVPKRMISAIQDKAHEIETFLDDYDARGNRRFAPITEFVACVRGFAEFERTIQHVISRFSGYHAGKPTELDGEFLEEASRTLAFANLSLRKLLAATVKEVASMAGRRVRRPSRARKASHEPLPRVRLPHDVAELPSLHEESKIAELGALYLAHKHTLDKLSDRRRFDDVKKMRRYVLEVSDEEQCRFFQTRIHNLQSKYDTFVKSTEAEKKDVDLRRFRGFVSITLHLMECMTQLVHFYERHENDIRGEEVKNRVAALIDKDQVLDRAVNFCLYFAHSYLNAGAPLADELVKRYTSQDRIDLELPPGVVLHIRPAALIAGIVKHHGTPVNVSIGRDTKYAGSVLDMLMAAGANAGVRTMTFEGDRRPLEDIRKLFEHRLGEDGLAGFPKELSYLRPGS